jgi:hypothetical protein
MNADDWSKEVDVTATKCMFFLGNRPLSSKTKETEEVLYSMHTRPLLSDNLMSLPNESMFTSEKQTLVINSNQPISGGMQQTEYLKPLQYHVDHVKRQSVHNVSQDFKDDMKRLIFTKQRISQNLSLNSTQIEFQQMQRKKEETKSKERYKTQYDQFVTQSSLRCGI